MTSWVPHFTGHSIVPSKDGLCWQHSLHQSYALLTIDAAKATFSSGLPTQTINHAESISIPCVIPYVMILMRHTCVIPYIHAYTIYTCVYHTCVYHTCVYHIYMRHTIYTCIYTCVIPYVMILIRIYIPSPNGLGIGLPVSHAPLCIVTTNHEATPEPVFIP